MKTNLYKSTLLATATLFALPAMAQDATPPQDDAVATESAEIVVTARRREERLQDVPVSVSAFSAEALLRSNITSATDLTTVTPGFTFASEGGKDTMALTLRGIGNLPIGNGTPSVVIYVNNVAIPSVGSNIPTYDVGSIQVLKGPQGTLFGKNTLGGAVLVASQEPDYELGGYVQGIYGRFDRKEFEGAVNIPVVDGKVAVRLAGQVRRQDPRIRAFEPGAPGFNNVHEGSFRATLLLEPTDWIRSVTTYERNRANELAGGLFLMRSNFSVGLPLQPAIDAQVAAQQDNPYSSYDGGINGGFANRTARSLINNTSLTFGDITVRNIFGYRKNYNSQLINTGATSFAPFVLFTAAQDERRKYLTDEFQILGDIGNLNFIVGAYYNKDQSYGPGGTTFTAFNVVPFPPTTSHVTNENKALFAQVGYKLTDALTLNAGMRYSWDKVGACGGVVSLTAYATEADCRAVASTGAIDGIGTVSNKGDAPSWTIGLDYKVDNDWLLYVVSRRGYRGANVNTPFFESAATTGQASTCNPNPLTGVGTGACPDLRPFQKTGKETVTDVEVGSKLSFRSGRSRGTFNVSAFYSKYKNALQFLNVTGVFPATTPDAPNNNAFGANISDQSIYGVEFQASVSPVPSFTASFNGAITKVKVDKFSLPATLPAGIFFSEANINKYTPSFSGTASISWTLPFHPADGDVVFDSDLFLTDDFGGQNGEKLPGYALANAQLTWKGIGGSGLDVAAFVKNLTNEQYLSGSSVFLQTFPISSGYLGEQRTYGVRARYTF